MTITSGDPGGTQIIETDAGTEGDVSSLPEETTTVFPEPEDPLNA